MGILNNGFRDVYCGLRFAGAGVSGGAAPSANVQNFHMTGANRNKHCGEATDDLLSVPAGATHPVAWVMPQKAGAMSSHNLTRGEGTATLSMAKGWNLAGMDSGDSTAQATLQLIVSMVATAAGSTTESANLKAALLMAGTADGSCTVTAAKNALGWLAGQADGTSTASLTSYATGRLSGAVLPYTELSPEALAAEVWNSMVAAYQEDGTMGKALGTASSGGVDLNLLAQAVLDAAQVTPIHSDIQKVNGVTVNGTGTESDPWGP